jgi:hypothetical protein
MSVMRKRSIVVILLCCLPPVSLLVWAQARKAGLWEVTTTQTWQQSPFPAGMPNPMGNGPRTLQVCVTQQQIDKYGAIPPQVRNCQVTNVNKKSDGMSAEVECTGAMSGKGTVEATWIDSEHAKSKVHFTGEMRLGPNTKPVEWTVEANSVFKSADCGSVKPMAMPPEH